MAERVGFEPTRGFNPPTRLAGECLQPLGHLSKSNMSGKTLLKRRFRVKLVLGSINPGAYWYVLRVFLTPDLRVNQRIFSVSFRRFMLMIDKPYPFCINIHKPELFVFGYGYHHKVIKFPSWC